MPTGSASFWSFSEKSKKSAKFQGVWEPVSDGLHKWPWCRVLEASGDPELGFVDSLGQFHELESHSEAASPEKNSLLSIYIKP